MKYLILSLVFLLSCSRQDDFMGEENIHPPSVEVKSKKVDNTVRPFHFIQFASFHDLRIESSEQILYEQHNFLFEENTLYKDLLLNYIKTEDFDVFAGIHRKEIITFHDSDLSLIPPKSDCSINLKTKLSIPELMKNKIRTGNIKLKLQLDFSDQRYIAIPARFYDRNQLLEENREYEIEVEDYINKKDCHQLIKKRGQLSIALTDIEMENGQSYFYQLEKQLEHRQLMIIIEGANRDYLTVPQNISLSKLYQKGLIPLIDQEKWHLFQDNIGLYIFQADLLDLEKTISTWEIQEQKVQSKWNIALPKGREEIEIYLKGREITPRPTPKFHSVGFHTANTYTFGVDYQNICDINNYEIIEYINELKTRNHWSPVPIFLWDGDRRISLWNLPDIEVSSVKNWLRVRLKLTSLKTEALRLEFGTVIRKHRYKMIPNYEPDLKLLCDQTYDYNKFTRNVMDRADYFAEVYYR